MKQKNLFDSMARYTVSGANGTLTWYVNTLQPLSY